MEIYQNLTFWSLWFGKNLAKSGKHALHSYSWISHWLARPQLFTSRLVECRGRIRNRVILEGEKSTRWRRSPEANFDGFVSNAQRCKFTASPTVSNTEINDINRTCQLILVSHPVFHRPFYEQPPPTIAPLLQWWPARPRKREWSSVRRMVTVSDDDDTVSLPG